VSNNDQFIFNEPIADKPSNRSKVVTRVSEDFQLTSAEKSDLYFLTKKCLEKRKAPKGKLPKSGFFYSGASWDRICAVISLYLLWRDGRCAIYENRKDYYDEMYDLNRKDFKELRKRVLDELERVMDVTFPYSVIDRQRSMQLC
jgi:hypothetical protein